MPTGEWKKIEMLFFEVVVCKTHRNDRIGIGIHIGKTCGHRRESAFYFYLPAGRAAAGSRRCPGERQVMVHLQAML